MDEQTQKLQTYIQGQLGAGQTPDEIAVQLRSAGWQEDVIQQGFQAVQTAVLPSSMQPAVSTPPPQALGQRRGRIRTGWQLLKQSFAILRGNNYLLRYLVMSGAWIFGIAAALFTLYWFIGQYVYDIQTDRYNLLGYCLLFLEYVLVYFFINLYAAGLTANILDIFDGQRKPYREYMRIAWSKAMPLLVLSVLSATVGVIMRVLLERVKYIGWILSLLLGATWSLGTMFVVPLIVSREHQGTMRSIKESISFFKQTWGEDVVAKITVNVPVFILQLILACVFWPAFVLAAWSGSMALVMTLVILYSITTIGLAVVASFANSLINIALFYYASRHQVPPAFSEDLLNAVFVKHTKRGLFGRKAKEAIA